MGLKTAFMSSASLAEDLGNETQLPPTSPKSLYY